MRLLHRWLCERDHALYGPVTLYNVRRAAKVNEDVARELKALRDCYGVERRGGTTADGERISGCRITTADIERISGCRITTADESG
jgi:hypothetical protein